jgi:hypothetical protein
MCDVNEATASCINVVAGLIYTQAERRTPNWRNAPYISPAVTAVGHRGCNTCCRRRQLPTTPVVDAQPARLPLAALVTITAATAAADVHALPVAAAAVLADAVLLTADAGPLPGYADCEAIGAVQSLTPSAQPAAECDDDADTVLMCDDDDADADSYCSTDAEADDLPRRCDDDALSVQPAPVLTVTAEVRVPPAAAPRSRPPQSWRHYSGAGLHRAQQDAETPSATYASARCTGHSSAQHERAVRWL